MLRVFWQRWRRTALILLSLAFVVFVGSLGAPAAFEICEKANASGIKDCSKYHFGPFVLLSVAAIGNTYNGLITAIATVLLTWITLRLAKLEFQNSETTKTELRAYVSVVPKKIALAEDKSIICGCDISNTGQTPAFGTYVLCDAAIREYPAPKPFNFIPDVEGQPVPQFDIAGHGGKHLIAPRIKVTDDEIALLKAGTHALYIYGRAYFIDVFRRNQWTEFCAFLTAEQLSSDLARSEIEKTEVAAGWRFTQHNNRSSY